MFKNYLKSAWRNILKQRMVSFINLFGITVGFTCCLLITCFVVNELSYDQFRQADHIYRVTRSFYTEKGVEYLHLASIAPAAGPLLKNDFPEIEKETRTLPLKGDLVLKYKYKMFNEQGSFFADSNFFSFFSVPVIEGNASTALADPFSMMVTPEIARKYFGSEDPINKIVQINGQFPVKITGIFRDFPANSTLHPNILLSFSTLNDSSIYGRDKLETSWDNNAFFTYLMLRDAASAQQLEKQFPAFLNRHAHYQGELPGYVPSKYSSLYLQKLRDVHLYSHLADEIEPNGSITAVYIFSVIALFILLIACINYMNLATAKSLLRTKEIGVRKTLGARRKELILQLLAESVILAYAALLIALLLTSSLVPWLNKVAGRNISFQILEQWKIIIPVLLLPLAAGFFSGIYPALFLSSFNPVKALKGIIKYGSKTIPVRKVLVVIQFTLSIILIIATAVVFSQMHFVLHSSLGFNKEHIITMPYNSALNDKLPAFKETLLQDPDIKSLALSSRIPSGRLLDATGIDMATGNSTAPVNITCKYVMINNGFIPTYQIQMAAGRNFDPLQFPTDSGNLIINEAAVRLFGWKNASEALGKDYTYNGKKGKVVGVVKNFHFESMFQEITPVLFALGSLKENAFNNMSIKIGGKHIQASIDKIRKTWDQFVPSAPFSFTFLDERFAKLYTAEQRQEIIFTIFACIAIFIACLGLFGLSAFTIAQRTKEIGIRKVLGASVNQIIQMLSKDFMKLVGLAALIALPAGWLCMHKWLQSFAYHVQVQWWLLLLAAFMAACIALMTIGVLALRAAMANPVESLRAE